MFHVANVGIPQAKCTQNLFGALGLAVGGSKSENEISYGKPRVAHSVESESLFSPKTP